ncbi:MAG: hypothetical protein CBC65_001085 [Rhodothermaceae bacterium TMED105]|jgi:hypothetical protein|nr:MAG: hypothetical protein CBC65_001085 [Rhodothermaceae bacterium TMED105]
MSIVKTIKIDYDEIVVLEISGAPFDILQSVKKSPNSLAVVLAGKKRNRYDSTVIPTQEDTHIVVYDPTTTDLSLVAAPPPAEETCLQTTQAVVLYGKTPLVGDVYRYNINDKHYTFTLTKDHAVDENSTVHLPYDKPTNDIVYAHKTSPGMLKYKYSDIPDSLKNALTPHMQALRAQRRHKNDDAYRGAYRNVYPQGGKGANKRFKGWVVQNNTNRVALTEDEQVGAVIAAAAIVDDKNIFSVFTSKAWIDHMVEGGDGAVEEWKRNVDLSRMPSY